MNRVEALQLLEQCLDEIPKLQQLPWKNEENSLWADKAADIIKAAFGENSDEIQRWRRATGGVYFGSDRAKRQQDYLDRLDRRGTAIKSILQKHQLLEAAPDASTSGERTIQHPKAFIAHGGENRALRKLKGFLDALGIDPIVVEEQPSEGRSIDTQVEWCLNQADCAIILATKGDVDSKTRQLMPRGNVLIEVGRCQERFPKRTIYLLEKGASFPSNISEKVWGRFTQDNMELAFIKAAKELAAFGLIRAIKS